MSNSRNFPSFRSGRKGNNNTDEPRSIESTTKLPVIDLHTYNNGQTGELVLHKDNLLYYCTGGKWFPLAVMDVETNGITKLLSHLIKVDQSNVIFKAPNENMSFVAGDNPTGVGGNVHIAAGIGGLADGEIIFETGGEPVLRIKDGSIKSSIARAEISTNTAMHVLAPEYDQDVLIEVEEAEGLPDVQLDTAQSILVVNLELQEGKTLTGKINNALLKPDSWVGLTIASSGAGVPHVWLDLPCDGYIEYHICSLHGELSKIKLYIDVRNSL